MAKQCPICEKGSYVGGTRKLLRGNYNPTKKSRKYPNLQWASLPDDGSSSAKAKAGKRIKICTRCLKKNLHLKKGAVK